MRNIRIIGGLEADGRLIDRYKVYSLVKDFVLIHEDDRLFAQDEKELAELGICVEFSNFTLPNRKRGASQADFHVEDNQYEEVSLLLREAGYILLSEEAQAARGYAQARERAARDLEQRERWD